MHEDVELKLWAVFGVHMFWEVREMLGEGTKSQPLQVLNKFVHGGLGFSFQKAQHLYKSILKVNSAEDAGDKSDEPIKKAEQDLPDEPASDPLWHLAAHRTVDYAEIWHRCRLLCLRSHQDQLV